MRVLRLLPLMLAVVTLIGLVAYGITMYNLHDNETSPNLVKYIDESNSLTADEIPLNTVMETTLEVPEANVPEEDVVEVNANDSIRINPSTRMIFQDYYLLDDTIETTESEPAYNVLNMSREDLVEYYEDWQVLYFTEERVILRRSIDDKNPIGYYIVKERDGEIAVYYDYTRDLIESFSEMYEPLTYDNDDFDTYTEEFLEKNETLYLREVLDMPISILSEEESYKLQEGILIYSEEELIKLLENYTS